MKNKSDIYTKAFEIASMSKKVVILAIVGCVIIPSMVIAQTINTSTTVTSSGGTSTTTGTDSIETTTGATLKQDAKSGAVNAQQQKEDEERLKEAEDVEYTGVYNGRQIVPEILAIYCKTNAEDFLADTSKIDQCLNKYLASMHNSDAALRSEGIEDYNALYLRSLIDLFAVASAKMAAVANYEDVQNDAAQTNRDAQTEREVGATVSNATSVATDVINGLRELYASELFVTAIKGLDSVDASAIDPEALAAADATADKNRRDISGELGDTSISSTAELKMGEDVEVDDDTIDGGTIPETTVVGNDPLKYGTIEDYDIDGGTLREVTVTGESPLHRLEAMSPEEFAANKEWVETLRANFIKQMNRPDAEDWEIADAQKSLDWLAEIERKQAAALAAQQAANNTGGRDRDADLTSAKALTPERFEKAAQAYNAILYDPESTESMKAEAQYFLDILAEAASTVLAGRPCAQVKRDLGLKIDCNEFHHPSN